MGPIKLILISNEVGKLFKNDEGRILEVYVVFHPILNSIEAESISI